MDLVSSKGYKWLSDFFDKDGTPIGNYTEHTIVTSWKFNYDFMIIDDKYVILVHEEAHLMKCSFSRTTQWYKSSCVYGRT